MKGDLLVGLDNFSFFDFMVLMTGGGWVEKKILERGTGEGYF